MLDLNILLIFIIIAVLIAIEAKDLLSSVVALGAAGLGLCMTFIVLKAPDVAITQLVVETLALIILIRATLRMDLPFSTSGRWLLNSLITVFFIGMFLFVASKSLSELPPFGYPLMRVASTYLREGFIKTGAANMVSAITLDYRALDTLCEGTALFTAVIGVLVVVRRIGKKKTLHSAGEVDE
jgi:multisubunit Na+/H+ antiporter MnhB subunit